MRKMILSILLMSALPQVYAQSSRTQFCEDYKIDKQRINLVKSDGWIFKDEENRSEYRYGCLDLKWRDELYKNICLNQNEAINLPKAIVYYFDGFGYFKPKEIKKDFNAVNLLGNENGGMLPYGLRALNYYIPGIRRYANWDRDVQFHYHSGSGSDIFQGIENAEACYTTMEKDLKVIEEYFPNLVQPKKIIMGHSNGGVNAINFVNHFANTYNSRFDLLITIDPVPKMGSFVVNKVFSKNPRTLTIDKKENIGKSINLYQSSNQAIMAGVMAIKGSTIDGIDKETRIENTNHVEILFDRYVFETITKEVSAQLTR